MNEVQQSTDYVEEETKKISWCACPREFENLHAHLSNSLMFSRGRDYEDELFLGCQFFFGQVPWPRSRSL